MPEPIFHLAVKNEWDMAVAAGTDYRRSTVDRSLAEVGFIHCSLADQVAGVAQRFYRGRRDLVLLVIQQSRVPHPIRVEGGFPHIYGPLPLDAVVAAEPVPVAEDGSAETAGLVGRWTASTW
jgi:glutathione S-transferase